MNQSTHIPSRSSALALDDLDLRILDLYRRDARYPTAQIARELPLSETAVRKRVRRLVDAEILAFAVSIDYDRVSSHAIEAYVEVTFPGDVDVHVLLGNLVRRLRRPEIREAITLLGDVDALIRVRTRNVAALRELVSAIRGSEGVQGTRTRIVAGNRWHGTVSGEVEEVPGTEDAS